MSEKNYPAAPDLSLQPSTNQDKLPPLRLRTKNIVWIALGFFAVLMFWYIYNYYVPLILEDMLEYRGVNNVRLLVGVIMAADSFFAILIMLTVGIASDKIKSKRGKGMPFIVVGAAITVIVFPFLPVLFLFNNLLGTIIMIGLVLTTMNLVRPATVALMPDVTPKPLRPKANAIINFVGYIGAILAGGIALVTSLFVEGTGNPVTEQSRLLLIPFIASCVAMAIAVTVLFLKIREYKLVQEMQDELKIGEQMAEVESAARADRRFTKQDKINLAILFCSLFFWWFAFSAVETFWSMHGRARLGDGFLVPFGPALLAIASLATFLPAIKLTKKIGRKKSVIVGLGLIIFAVIPMAFVTPAVPLFNIWLALGLAIAGAGWAIVNISAFPMFVEFADKDKVGRYTGYYYLATMSAQTLTPILAGWLVGDTLGWWALFPYTAVFMSIALALMLFFRPRNSGASVGQKTQTSDDA